MARLRRMTEAGRLPHALMFYGPAGVGKSLAAREIIGAYLCENKNLCGSCPSCRALKAETHGDMHVILPEVSEKGAKSIKIDAIRALQTEIASYPVLSRGRAVLIDDAPAMNEQAMNCLLKTLEEPPGEILFILIAGAKTALLPTVVSRCAAVSFGRLAPEQIGQILTKAGCDAASATKLSLLADGSPGRALALMQSDSLSMAQDAAAFAHSLTAPNLGTIWEKSAELEKTGKEKITEWLRYFVFALRDALVRKITGAGGDTSLLYGGEETGLERLPETTLLNLVKLAEETQHKLRFNVNMRLQTECFMIRAGEMVKGGA